MHDLIVSRQGALLGERREWSAAQITAAHAACARARVACAGRRAAAIQPFPPVRVEKEYATLYRKFGLARPSRSPLASGLLTGKYRGGYPTRFRLAAPGLEWLRDIVSGSGRRAPPRRHPKTGEDRHRAGHDLASPRRCLVLEKPPGQHVILGASRVAQLQENLGRIEIVERLTPAVLARLDTISRPVAE